MNANTPRRRGLNLWFFSLASLFLLGLVVFYGIRAVEDLSQASILEASQLILDASSSDVEDAVQDFLRPCTSALEDFEAQLHLEILTPAEYEKDIFGTLHAETRISEITFTSAHLENRNGQPVTSQVEQLSVFRSRDGRFVSRRTHQTSPLHWVAKERSRVEGQIFDNPPWQPISTPVKDPSDDPSFRLTASKFLQGADTDNWSDLNYCQVDASLPPDQRRAEVSFQGAVLDKKGQFVGVLRVGLISSELNQCFDSLDELSEAGEHFFFLSDPQGRLVTPVLTGATANTPTALVPTAEGQLRLSPAGLPEPVQIALKEQPLTRSLPLQSGGKTYLARLRALDLKGPGQWRAGLIIAQSSLAGQLPARRQQLLYTALIAASLASLLVLAVMEGLRRQLSQLARTANAMKRFEFEPLIHSSWLSEVADVADSLETAKGTLRAMVCYVPVELVRQLFNARLKPVLSSHPQVITLMFSDVVGFTSTAEKLTPDELAACLGRYLESMNEAIHAQHGTVLERVGDALLSIWNAPNPLEHSETWACRAALACSQAITNLPDSQLLQTRFGVHTDQVLVGHFGSKDRMNYGVLGDGVNFASRLEGLNKQYGTSILISAQVACELDEEFVVRKLDFVAVKGKLQGILIYELVGLKSQISDQRIEVIRTYEKAWAVYQEGKFSQAAELFQSGAESDHPSRILGERCRTMAANPPRDWDGAFRATDK